MKLLLDINIVLDVALARPPWATEAVELLAMVEQGRAEAWVAGHMLTTLYYIAARARGRAAAQQFVVDLLRVVRVAALGDRDFQQALILGLDDFEDAVQAAAALQVGADYLVTRDAAHFRGIPIPVRAAGEVAALLQAGTGG